MNRTGSAPKSLFTDASRPYFLLGSLAPDSVYIAHMLTTPSVRSRLTKEYNLGLPGFIRNTTIIIDDIHQVKPATFTLQLLSLADSEEEQAFALGWVSHYVVDSFIHDLISRHGGSVVDPDLFDSQEMITHNRLEAWEMRHVFQLDGENIRESALITKQAILPMRLLRNAFSATFPQNSAFSDQNAKVFAQAMDLSSQMINGSTRWYAYQSTHTPTEINRMKKLIRRFRPQQGKLLSALTDLPSIYEYEAEIVNSPFLREWKIRAAEVKKSSNFLFTNCLAFYWWKNRDTPFAKKMAAETLKRIEAELHRINPDDNLMLPRQNR
jgi:hypothetical protein